MSPSWNMQNIRFVQFVNQLNIAASTARDNIGKMAIKRNVRKNENMFLKTNYM